ncbi:MAG: EVE domain-containing protein [Phycisphaerae bacterium]|nr:EVE domain-containing protein [Phycisphaerae bacterium]
MPAFLLKTEPSDYAFADLERDGTTLWTGIKSPAAQLALRNAKKGDDAFIYHTGSEKQIVGLARITRGPFPDPTDKEGKRVAIELKALKAVKTPVTLTQIKGDKRFADFALVKQSRLSVMPVPAAMEKVLREWAGVE